MIAYLFNVLFPKYIRGWFTETFTAMDYFPLLTYAGETCWTRHNGILHYNSQILEKTIM